MMAYHRDQADRNLFFTIFHFAYWKISIMAIKTLVGGIIARNFDDEYLNLFSLYFVLVVLKGLEYSLIRLISNDHYRNGYRVLHLSSQSCPSKPRITPSLHQILRKAASK
jgi:hypothetical protein